MYLDILFGPQLCLSPLRASCVVRRSRQGKGRWSSGGVAGGDVEY